MNNNKIIQLLSDNITSLSTRIAKLDGKIRELDNLTSKRIKSIKKILGIKDES